jgi:hypothetical protein
MGFAAGKLTTLAQKRGVFGEYWVAGSWVEDTRGRTGWLIDLDGAENGTFTVLDNEVYRSGRQYSGSKNGKTLVATDNASAEIGDETKQRIFDAIGQWEKEERAKAANS